MVLACWCRTSHCFLGSHEEVSKFLRPLPTCSRPYQRTSLHASVSPPSFSRSYFANKPRRANASNYWSFLVTGIFFNGFIRRRFRGWWLNYNYILSAALDSGLAFAIILIFLAVQLKNIDPPSWWGNNVMGTTLDVQHNGINSVKMKLPEGQTFGRSTWE
jgi:hypothetical protein